MIISLFVLKQGRCPVNNYVDLYQSLICVAHDAKPLCFASKYIALFIYVCGPILARV